MCETSFGKFLHKNQVNGSVRDHTSEQMYETRFYRVVFFSTTRHSLIKIFLTYYIGRTMYRETVDNFILNWNFKIVFFSNSCMDNIELNNYGLYLSTKPLIHFTKKTQCRDVDTQL